jgi:hypothetical protein
MPTRRPLAIAAALLALLSGIAGSTALAASDHRGEKASQAHGGGVALHVPQSVRSSLQLRGARLLPKHRRGRVRLLGGEPMPGEARLWVGLDVVNGVLEPKPFAFRGAGKKIEVWVAGDLDFLPGDCRNGARTQVSDAQVAGLIRAFDRVIYPREAAIFGVPPTRDGGRAQVGPPFQSQGRGDRVVVLVDNIRDEAYFDFDNSQGFGSVIGIYSSFLDDIFDRNVITIDAYDWLHRTGPRPQHEPAAGDNCADAPAWPHLIEGVFAHEYAHLLQHQEDADEADWSTRVSPSGRGR